MNKIKKMRPKKRAAGIALICAAALMLAANILFLCRALNTIEALSSEYAYDGGTLNGFLAMQKKSVWLIAFTTAGLVALGAAFGAKHQRTERELNTKNELLAQERRRISASEQRYRLLARDSDVIVFNADIVKKVIEVDVIFKKKLGYELTYENYISGRRVHPEDRARFIGYISEIKRNRCTLAGEVRVMAADGAYLSFELVECGSFNEAGELVGIVGKLSNITRRRASEVLLEKRAMMDEMTGVLNRGATEKLICEHMGDRRSCGKSLLIIDVDNLKRINDSGGHMAGDAAIRRVASALRNQFRSTDIIGRIGGDEFMVFANEACARDRLSQIAGSIKRQLSEAEDQKEAVSCSIGICIAEGRNVSFDEMYSMADTALYSVKRSGKGGYAFYTPAMGEERSENCAR